MELASGAIRRNLYFFTCSGCGKDRETVFKKHADHKVCRACRSRAINKDQQPLFNEGNQNEN